MFRARKIINKVKNFSTENTILRKKKKKYVKKTTEELIAALEKEENDYKMKLTDPNTTLLKIEEYNQNLERIKALKKFILDPDLDTPETNISENKDNFDTMDLIKEEMTYSGDVVGIESEKRNNKFYQGIDYIKDEEGYKGNNFSLIFSS